MLKGCINTGIASVAEQREALPGPRYLCVQNAFRSRPFQFPPRSHSFDREKARSFSLSFNSTTYHTLYDTTT